jgi:hypothetical protein
LAHSSGSVPLAPSGFIIIIGFGIGAVIVAAIGSRLLPRINKVTLDRAFGLKTIVGGASLAFLVITVITYFIWRYEVSIGTISGPDMGNPYVWIFLVVMFITIFVFLTWRQIGALISRLNISLDNKDSSGYKAMKSARKNAYPVYDPRIDPTHCMYDKDVAANLEGKASAQDMVSAKEFYIEWFMYYAAQDGKPITREQLEYIMHTGYKGTWKAPGADGEDAESDGNAMGTNPISTSIDTKEQ